METLNTVTGALTALALLIDVALRTRAAVRAARRPETSPEDDVA